MESPRPDQQRAATLTLAEAFATDPLLEILAPDPARRVKLGDDLRAVGRRRQARRLRLEAHGLADRERQRFGAKGGEPADSWRRRPPRSYVQRLARTRGR